MRSNLEDIKVIAVHQTKLAYLVKADEDSPGVWIPKSQCQIDDPFIKGKIVELTAEQSVLEEKGLV